MKYTPQIIAGKQCLYSIPIYQRLFEWSADNIVTLLDDLHKTFILSRDNDDYYIGMLTSTTGKELVDGQQRFSVMMLIGCVLQRECYHPEWKKFLLSNDQPRLRFSSRPDDNKILHTLMKPDYQYRKKAESKLEAGFNHVYEYFENVEKVKESERKDFAKYIFEHLSFFIEELPEGYSPRDLNRYFERMNTAGKNLEQHEILKVKLLSQLENASRYMSLWNRLADTDKLLITKRTKDGKKEDDSAIIFRKNQAFLSDIDTIVSNEYLNGLHGAGSDEEDFKIIDIDSSKNAPSSEKEHYSGSRCALSFPYILLQTLYRWIKKSGKSIEGSINDFFKPTDLLDIFSKYLPYEGNDVNKDDIKSFLSDLVKSRLSLDICFIRPTEFGYFLDVNLDEDSPELKNLLMLESMLFVSSSNYTHYKWFGCLMDCVEKSFGTPSADLLFRAYKEFDRNNNSLPTYEQLSYGADHRYWFWKLDYIIWTNREQLFGNNPEALLIANNYIFKRNRSIEHIAPQTPETDSAIKWDETNPDDEMLKNSFGNLVMISQGLNSALSNSSYEMKKEHVRSYITRSKTGSIESLKLLLAYLNPSQKWDKQTIVEHGKFSYKLLQDNI